MPHPTWNYSAYPEILLHRCSWPRLPLDEIKPPHLEIKVHREVAWVFQKCCDKLLDEFLAHFTNLMGGKLMVKKHNLHKCTCPFFLFWPFLIRSSLAECQLNNQLLGLTSRVQNMVVMVVKIQIGVQDLTTFCLNVKRKKENDIVTGLKKSTIWVLKSIF